MALKVFHPQSSTLSRKRSTSPDSHGKEATAKMSIYELLDQLNLGVSQLDKAGINDDARFDLESLIIEIKQSIIRYSVNPLRDISQMSVVDVSQLRDLVPQVQHVIKDEHSRTELVVRIISVARHGLRGAGLPLSA
jgi:hypothetical protein